MKRVLAVCMAMVCIGAIAPSGFCDDAKPPIKCLMVGKGPHKDPAVMDDVIADIQANAKTIALTVTENLEDLRYDNLKNFDVLVLVQIVVEGGNPPDFVRDGITQFLKDRKGLVVTHFAVANMQEWRDSIDVLGAMWVSGKSTHNPYHEFRVDVKQEEHPILEGVKPFITNDELYFNLLMRPDMNVLLTGNEERAGHTVSEPLLCTHYAYNARCVYFALGHDAKSVSYPEYRKILVQSVEWAACRR